MKKLTILIGVLVSLALSWSYLGAQDSAWITEFDKKDVDLTGLDEKSLNTVLKVLNENNCTCCKQETLAHCLKHDPKCGTDKILANELIQQAKQGKSEDYLLGLIAGASLSKPAKEPPAPNNNYAISVDKSPWKGTEKAPIVIVEFTDFQCPYCAKAAATMNQVLQAYPTQVKLYVKNFPLSFHKFALDAALASLAAKEQGKYWEMHDALFENYKSLSKEKILELAQKIGLDVDRFKKSLEDQQLKQQIELDMTDFRNVKATGTPTFFVNGKRIVGGDFNMFKQVIEEELARLNSNKLK